jgi:hypothetical protein
MRATLIGRLLLAMAFFTSPFVARPALAFPHPKEFGDCVADRSGATFAAKMLFIGQGYQPASAIGAPRTGAGVPQWMKDAVASAFRNASQTFQFRLCLLDGIYVDPNASNKSWGYRDRSANNRYVALSSSLFNPNTKATLPFSSNATYRLNAILRTQPNTFYFGPTTDDRRINIDNTSLTILAALAHEYGHIYWHDENKDAYRDYDYHFCKGSFLDYSWSSSNRPPGDPWIPLGALIGEHRIDGESDNVVSVQSINAARGNPQRLQPILIQLYDPQSRWATALAAFSPVEDFVETFQNVVLTTSDYHPASQPLYGSGGTQQIGDTFLNKDNSDKFRAKKNCFTNPQ